MGVTDSERTWTCDFPGCDEYTREQIANGWGSWHAYGHTNNRPNTRCACPVHTRLVEALFAGELGTHPRRTPTGTQVIGVGDVTKLGPPPRIEHAPHSREDWQPQPVHGREPWSEVEKRIAPSKLTRASWWAKRWQAWGAMTFEQRAFYVLIGAVMALTCVVVYLAKKVSG